MMFKKLILSFLLVFVMFFGIFSVKVLASPIKEFKDLAETDIYFEDVMHFVEQGVINGKDDGLFHPEEFITVSEVITITEKVLGNKNNLPDSWNWWANPTYKGTNGWTPDWYFPLVLFKGDYTKAASRNVVSCILLNIAKAPIVKPEVWGLDSHQENENSIYFLNMVLRGYWQGENAFYLGVTRGEFCHLLRWFMNNKQPPQPENEILVNINQKYLGDIPGQEKIQHYYRVYNSVMKIPKNIQKLFVKKGYSFYIVDDEYWEKNCSDIPTAGGVYYSYSHKKKIFIRDLDERTVFHEFGHFIEDYYPEYFRKVEKIYEKDEWELIMLVNAMYPKSSPKEYFADGFATYLIQPDNLKEKLPELYEIYNDLMKEINSLDL